MRAPSFIKALSFPPTRRSGSHMVAPLPRESSFYQVIGKVDIIRSVETDVGSSDWFSSVLDASTATQRLAKEYTLDGIYSNSNLSTMDKEMINEYLEDNIELLDACNGLVEKMSVIQEYVHTLKAATRSSRAQEVLTKCGQLEKECAKLDKCNSKLISRLMGQKMNTQVNISYDLQEVLCMSREVATIACFRLQRALSLKSKQGFMKLRSFKSTIFNSLLISKDENVRQLGQKCGSSWMMNELEQLIMAYKLWDDEQVNVDLLRKNCETLEEGLKMLEEKVRELYRHLISIRVALLGILSQY